MESNTGEFGDSPDDFWNATDCERVEMFLRSGSPEGFDSYFLWNAKAHVEECDLCRRRSPHAFEFLSREVTRFEFALAAELDTVRGDYLRITGEIRRGALLACPGVTSLESLLLDKTIDDPQVGGSVPVNVVKARLISALARAGRNVKNVLETIHGQGLVYFEVVVDKDNDEEIYAWDKCAGLIRRLSRETREFAFAAALAAEIFPNLAEYDPDFDSMNEIDLGVLHFAIHAASNQYLEQYWEHHPEKHSSAPAAPITSALSDHPPLTDMLNRVLGAIRERNGESENQPSLNDLFSGQTAMMGVMAEMEGALRELRLNVQAAPDLIKQQSEATLRDALGTQFDELSASTREFLLVAECGYAQQGIDLDFSPVVVSFTKAFEFELHRVVDPFLKDVATQSTAPDNRDVSKLTLGQLLSFLKGRVSKVAPLFRDHRLNFNDICMAIEKVNAHAAAKHSARMSKLQVTDFRTIFLGINSVLRFLRPRK